MNIETLFARRYLFSRNSRSVINIIAGVSIAAVAVPVAAMIILLSVFNGFETIIRGMHSITDADVSVSAARGASFATETLPRERILSAEGVGAAGYIVEQGAMAGYLDRRIAVTVRGVDESFAEVVPIDDAVTAGAFEVQRGEDFNGTVLGRGLAYDLGVRSYIVDDITLYALRRNAFSMLLPADGFASATLPVTGIYAVDAETDSRSLYVSLRTAQRLFDYEGRASAMVVRGREGVSPETLKKSVAAAAGEDFCVRTREEADASVYRIMRYEKWGIFLIALIVLVIASLSVVGVLVMLILEKRRDIETLRAVGASRPLVRRIFESEGMLICMIGGAAGIVIGAGLSLAQQHLGIIALPARSFAVSVYPVELRAGDVAAVVAAFWLTARAISYATVRSMIKKEI